MVLFPFHQTIHPFEVTARTSFYNHERASNISTWPCLPGPRAHAASINDFWVFKTEVLIAHDITILQNASRCLRRVKSHSQDHNYRHRSRQRRVRFRDVDWLCNSSSLTFASSASTSARTRISRASACSAIIARFSASSIASTSALNAYGKAKRAKGVGSTKI